MGARRQGRYRPGFSAPTKAFLLGLLFLFLLLETALRVTGAFYRPQTAHLAPPVGGDHSIRVLCLGDSFTYGIGASSGHDYPHQLARTLQQMPVRASATHTRKTWTVFNGGIPGANTATVLSTLDTSLPLFQPHVVVVLAGTNNEMNYAGYRAYLDRNTWSAHLVATLHTLRVVRLFSFMTTRFRELERAGKRGPSESLRQPGHGRLAGAYKAWHQRTRPNETLPPAFLEGVDWLAVGLHQRALEAFRRGIESSTRNTHLCWGMGEAYRGLLELDQARRWFQEAHRSDPANPWPYYSLGRLALDQEDDPTEARNWFARGMEAAPDFGNNYAGTAIIAWTSDHQPEQAIDLLRRCIQVDPDNTDCYPELAALAKHLGMASETASFLENTAKGHPLAQDYARMLRVSSTPERVAAWIRTDLTRIVQQVRDAGAIPVLLTYPNPEPTNAIVTQVAQTSHCILVDLESVFLNLLDQGTPRNALFVPDGHCNDRGYGIIAQRVARTVSTLEGLPAATAE